MGRDDRDADRKIQRLPEKIFSDAPAAAPDHVESASTQ